MQNKFQRKVEKNEKEKMKNTNNEGKNTLQNMVTLKYIICTPYNYGKGLYMVEREK